MNHEQLSTFALGLGVVTIIGVSGHTLREGSEKTAIENNRKAMVANAAKFVAGNSYGIINEPINKNIRVDPKSGLRVFRGSDGRWITTNDLGFVESIIESSQMNAAVSDRRVELEQTIKQRKELGK